MMKVDHDGIKRVRSEEKWLSDSLSKKGTFFFPFIIIDVCKPGRGQLVREIILKMMDVS